MTKYRIRWTYNQGIYDDEWFDVDPTLSPDEALQEAQRIGFNRMDQDPLIQSVDIYLV